MSRDGGKVVGDKAPELKARFTLEEVKALRKPGSWIYGRHELFDSLFFDGRDLGNVHLYRRGWDLVGPRFREDRVEEARAFACVFAYGDPHLPGLLQTEDEIEDTLDLIHRIRLERIIGVLPLDGKMLVIQRLGLIGAPFTQEEVARYNAEFPNRTSVSRRERTLARQIRGLPAHVTKFPNCNEVTNYRLRRRLSVPV